jgi:hypothetical protein
MRTEGLASLMMFLREDKIVRRTIRNRTRTERLRMRVELRRLSRLRTGYIQIRLRRIARRLERLDTRRQDVLWYFKNKWVAERGQIFE